MSAYNLLSRYYHNRRTVGGDKLIYAVSKYWGSKDGLAVMAFITLLSRLEVV